MPTREPKRRDDSNDPAIGCEPPLWAAFALAIEALKTYLMTITTTVIKYTLIAVTEVATATVVERVQALTAAPHGPTVAGARWAA